MKVTGQALDSRGQRLPTARPDTSLRRVEITPETDHSNYNTRAITGQTRATKLSAMKRGRNARPRRAGSRRRRHTTLGFTPEFCWRRRSASWRSVFPTPRRTPRLLSSSLPVPFIIVFFIFYFSSPTHQLLRRRRGIQDCVILRVARSSQTQTQHAERNARKRERPKTSG